MKVSLLEALQPAFPPAATPEARLKTSNLTVCSRSLAANLGLHRRLRLPQQIGAVTANPCLHGSAYGVGLWC